LIHPHSEIARGFRRASSLASEPSFSLVCSANLLSMQIFFFLLRRGSEELLPNSLGFDECNKRANYVVPARSEAEAFAWARRTRLKHLG
jgi:hypothetical protein